MEETIEFEGNESGQALVAQLDLVFTEIQEKEDIIALAKSKGDQAKEKAQGVSTNFFKRKQAVEDLKDAQISNAEATVGALEAIEQVSVNQQRLSELFQSFVHIGMVDIATNRAVVAYIQKVMSDDSEQTISEETKEQLLGVIRDLKAKEDLLVRQEKQGEKIKDHDKRITAVESAATSLETAISSTQKHQSKQDDLLEKQKKKDLEHDARLDSGDKTDKRQDAELEAQRKKDIEHDRRFSENETINRNQDELLEQQKKKDKEHDSRLESGEKHDVEQDAVLSELTKRIEELEASLFKNQADEIQRLSDENKELMRILQKNKIISFVGGSLGVVGIILAIVALII